LKPASGEFSNVQFLAPFEVEPLHQLTRKEKAIRVTDFFDFNFHGGGFPKRVLYICITPSREPFNKCITPRNTPVSGWINPLPDRPRHQAGLLGRRQEAQRPRVRRPSRPRPRP